MSFLRRFLIAGTLCALALGCRGLAPPPEPTTPVKIIRAWETDSYSVPENARPEDHVIALTRYLSAYANSAQGEVDGEANPTIPLAKNLYRQLTIHVPVRLGELTDEERRAVVRSCENVYDALEGHKLQWDALPSVHSQFGRYGSGGLFEDIRESADHYAGQAEQAGAKIIVFAKRPYKKAS